MTEQMRGAVCVGEVLIALARGYSGVRPELVDALVALYNADVLPRVPSKGSVGASGDLAPLAHMSAVLLGVGEAEVAGRVMPAAEGLKRAGLSTLTLAAKEGLALLNGTQTSTALALCNLFAIDNLYATALVAGALSVDAAEGSASPFDARIHELRGHPGQIAAAAAYRELLATTIVFGLAFQAARAKPKDWVGRPTQTLVAFALDRRPDDEIVKHIIDVWNWQFESLVPTRYQPRLARSNSRHTLGLAMEKLKGLNAKQDRLPLVVRQVVLDLAAEAPAATGTGANPAKPGS